jgi:uncharacterized OB-fold protein
VSGATFPAVERDEASASFFDAARDGRLRVQRCLDCARVVNPESRLCPVCGSAQLEPHLATGRGHLVSWAVVHHAPVPALADAVPYVSGLVELDEGPWLLVRLVDALDRELSADLAVHAVFVPPTVADDDVLGEVLVAFAPDGEA